MNSKASSIMEALQKNAEGDKWLSGIDSGDSLSLGNTIPHGVPTGLAQLDLMLGRDGLPATRVLEFYGKEATGKSALAIKCAGAYQKVGGLILYIDTSVVLRRLFRVPGYVRHFSLWKSAYSSVLLRIEARRTLDRTRLEGGVDDNLRAEAEKGLVKQLKSMTLISISDSILGRAEGSFPTVIGTLDAIHLATALKIKDMQGESLTFMTHDDQLARAAESVGFKTIGT